jgi:signal transduction histidine kinase
MHMRHASSLGIHTYYFKVQITNCCKGTVSNDCAYVVYAYHRLHNILPTVQRHTLLYMYTQVTHDAAAQQIALTVADTGRGIPDEFRDLIFHTVG